MWCVCMCVYGEREGEYMYGKFNGHIHVHMYHSRYFTEDVPVLLFTSLPFTLLGVWQCPSPWSRAPFWLALWELIVHSALSHKEHRHVLPIVPIASIYAGNSCANKVEDFIMLPLGFVLNRLLYFQSLDQI